MRYYIIRFVIRALIVFLLKLTTGNSNRLITTSLGLEHEYLVSKFSNQIVRCFEKDILLFCFGFNTMIREDLIDNHTTYIAKKYYTSLMI